MVCLSVRGIAKLLEVEQTAMIANYVAADITSVPATVFFAFLSTGFGDWE